MEELEEDEFLSIGLKRMELSICLNYAKRNF